MVIGVHENHRLTKDQDGAANIYFYLDIPAQNPTSENYPIEQLIPCG